MTELILMSLPYTAVSLSIIARFIFMYLLYTKRSTNVYSLAFCYLSVLSSSLWVPYGVMKEDIPIIVRSSIEMGLLSVSAIYIHWNRYKEEVKILPLITTITVT
jgi:lipid-A-disaccharide synthase-like uncharacterized protein